MKWLHCNISDYTQEEYNSIYSALSSSRKIRIDRLKVPADRLRSLAGEMLIKNLLANEYGIKNAIIDSDEKGKPFAAGLELCISIAHCDGIVVCVADEKPIGIDIERIRPINLAIAKRVCVDEEAEYLFGRQPMISDYCLCTDTEVLSRFYEIWTAKEAYFKKLGTGITNFKLINILSLQRQKFRLDEYFIQIVF